jgi:hypothetical protein
MNWLYVASASSAGIIEISLPGLTVSRTIVTPAVASDIELSSDGTRIYAAMPASGQVAEIDRASGSLTAIVGVPVGEDRLAPAGLDRRVFAYSRGLIYLPNAGHGEAPCCATAHLIDFATGTTVSERPFFWPPLILASPSSFGPNRALDAAEASLIDLSSGAETPVLGLGVKRGVVGSRLIDGRILLAREIWVGGDLAPNPVPDELAILGTGINASTQFTTTYSLPIQ